MEYHTPLHTYKITESELMDELGTSFQQAETIPALPTSEIVQKVTENSSFRCILQPTSQGYSKETEEKKEGRDT